LLLVAGCWLLVAGFWLLVAGSWVLVAGCWLLVAGSWVLVAGCWLLVAGSWVLVARFSYLGIVTIRDASVLLPIFTGCVTIRKANQVAIKILEYIFPCRAIVYTLKLFKNCQDTNLNTSVKTLPLKGFSFRTGLKNHRFFFPSLAARR
jgi:hypothetical protein